MLEKVVQKVALLVVERKQGKVQVSVAIEFYLRSRRQDGDRGDPK